MIAVNYFLIPLLDKLGFMESFASLLRSTLSRLSTESSMWKNHHVKLMRNRNF